MSWIVTAIAISAISAGVSAYGSYAQGQAQKKMNQYNADVSNRQAEIDAQVAEQQEILNKRTAETNITLVQSDAAAQTKLARRNQALMEGETKGMLAKSGIGGGSVTSADLLDSSFETAKIDREMIRYNADSKAYAIKSGYDVESWKLKTGIAFDKWNLKNQANQYGMAGKNAARAGSIGATTSVLQGASSIANTGMTYGLLKS